MLVAVPEEHQFLHIETRRRRGTRPQELPALPVPVSRDFARLHDSVLVQLRDLHRILVLPRLSILRQNRRDTVRPLVVPYVEVHSTLRGDENEVLLEHVVPDGHRENHEHRAERQHGHTPSRRPEGRAPREMRNTVRIAARTAGRTSAVPDPEREERRDHEDIRPRDRGEPEHDSCEEPPAPARNLVRAEHRRQEKDVQEDDQRDDEKLVIEVDEERIDGGDGGSTDRHAAVEDATTEEIDRGREERAPEHLDDPGGNEASPDQYERETEKVRIERGPEEHAAADPVPGGQRARPVQVVEFIERRHLGERAHAQVHRVDEAKAERNEGDHDERDQGAPAIGRAIREKAIRERTIRTCAIPARPIRRSSGCVAPGGPLCPLPRAFPAQLLVLLATPPGQVAAFSAQATADRVSGRRRSSAPSLALLRQRGRHDGFTQLWSVFSDRLCPHHLRCQPRERPLLGEPGALGPFPGRTIIGEPRRRRKRVHAAEGQPKIRILCVLYKNPLPFQHMM